MLLSEKRCHCLFIRHRDKDWRAGTDKASTLDNPRGYHKMCKNRECILYRPLPFGAFQDQYKKNYIYKRSREVEVGATENNTS